ncbi:Baculoviral IAP repeat-containing protein 1 [Myotis brandtii]|uniref:Baculoviral IAP repeat-containing protein 1 n=1 Tax=Myotis brandtii TaxID=109478 RepID=S7ME52_MYOBR|nr:Baculoviral IAP repeat-containing protein 1 [Myotis brandtii]
MASQEEAADQRISQHDETAFPQLSALLGIDMVQFVKEIEKKEQEDREKMQKGFNSEMRSEAKRLKTFVTYDSYSSWTPQEMAAAGFYFTGIKSGVQCFCCSLILFCTTLKRLPIEHHKKFSPHCEFLLGKDVGNIAKYDIRVKNPESKMRGDKAKYQEEKARLESFHDWPFYAHGTSPRELSAAGFVFTAFCNDSIFANEELRLESFKKWPHAFPGGAAALAKAGLFYIGIEDTVQCFSCGGCMNNWVEGDDPLGDHSKYFPDCLFLQNLKASAEVIPDLQSHDELSELTETISETSLEDSAAVSSLVPETAQSEAQWFEEAKSLNQRLKEAYTDASFRRMYMLEVSSSLATDHLLSCDLSLASKHISTPVQKPVLLSDVFANLNSVMCVEGEAGSGKTVLLKKIALLWASGCCPLLNRFQLVFYLSLNSTRLDQGLANIICDQLLETEGSVTEMSLRNIMQQLKNQVLFLLDDYKEMCSVPQVIQKLIHKNHSSRTCLLIAVRTNRTKDIRQYLHTILEIKAFPFYNTVYILRKFFSHDLIRLQKFMIHFKMNADMQGIQKTPLFVAAVCANWFRNPFDRSYDHVTVFKSYIECLSLKHKLSAERFKANVSSCGKLALKGFFSSCFEFSDDDLVEAGVDEDEDLTMCLMSKFTAQRLRPVYQFLDPAFQEFLAGMGLIVLLDSDRQEDQDLGLYYLKQIHSSMMTLSSCKNFLMYVSCYPSTKAGPKIVSHLLHLLDNKKSLENLSEKDDLKHHPEVSESVCLYRSLWQLSPEDCFSLVSKHLLTFAIKIAYQSNTVEACSPFILQFLQGRTLTLDMLNLPYFFDHPESLLLLRSIKVSVTGNMKIMSPVSDSSCLERCWDKSQAPTIQQDCAAAFEDMMEWEQNIVEKQKDMLRFMSMIVKAPPDISTGYWKLSPKQHKIPLLEVHVTNMDGVDQETLRVLMAVFSASQHIELHLRGSRGFIESLCPAIEQYKASFTKCSINESELNAVEQELLLNLPSLESLEVSGTTQITDQLFPNLDKFPCLKELSVNMDKKNVFSVIPEEFLNLHNMKKLLIEISAENGPSKIVTILTNFISLKILDLKFQEFPDKETSEKFAHTLGSLSNLEELILPNGDGIHQVAKLIIQQCQHLRCLRVLSFFKTLNDDSVMEIAKVAISGGFQKLENLDLSLNHKITEEGYRNFFQVLDNLPNLQELTISRHYTECIRVQATTVKSLSQCMLRLPSLTTINMLSWLLDAEDITLLTSTKEKHPQSKLFNIHWKWRLPFSPIIQK